jgi:UDP-N-acetylglucosamine 2-epimerase (non-hydrolysing)
MYQDIKVLDPEHLDREVAVVIGTRPGIVMFAPIIHELRMRQVAHLVIHTGQHYSPNMDEQFFEDLNLPSPDYKLKGISAKKTHGGQTASMLEGIEKVLLERKPRLVLVGGDANTNLSGALAARKLRIQVGHVEAGERSFDWRMPEEHNRRMIDHISDHLFVTGEKSKSHLLRENIQGKIYLTGNPIVDASLRHAHLAKTKSDALKRFNLIQDQYGVLTTHREENVDFAELLQGSLEGVSRASNAIGIPVLFLAHPRTIKRLKEFKLWEWAHGLPGIKISEALGYLDFTNLLSKARLAFTDSGGVQQEACIHHVPAVTLRENTEWVETLEIGANRLAGTEPARIEEAAVAACQVERAWEVPFGDGKAAGKIVDVCVEIVKQ